MNIKCDCEYYDRDCRIKSCHKVFELLEQRIITKDEIAIVSGKMSISKSYQRKGILEKFLKSKGIKILVTPHGKVECIQADPIQFELVE